MPQPGPPGMRRIDLAHGWRSSLVAGTRYVECQGQHPDLTQLEPPGQDDVEPVVLLPGQEFSGPLHVLPQHRHLFLDLLNPHLGFDLEFLEELGLNQIGLLTDQLLRPAFRAPVPGSGPATP